MKKIVILGSTGSIGTQALEIIEKYPDRFRAVGLSCNRNVRLFLSQIEKFRPDFVAVADEQAAQKIKSETDIPVFSGAEGVKRLASINCDVVLNALVGISGLEPTLAAIEAGRDVALANKETLVAGGDIVMPFAKAKNVKILPVDSEHSAIWQSIGYGSSRNVKKLLLTASGGPFKDLPKESFSEITPKDALKHPTWSMGAKVSIDSATMMNKGLEVIEAAHLFSIDAKNIDVLIHKSSIAHSFAAFDDSAVIAELSYPSMKIPIALSLSYPDRLDVGVRELDLAEIGNLCFERPDYDKFECLKIAIKVAKTGGILPVVMNAANEIAVEYFLKGIIKFNDIPYYINKATEKTVFERVQNAEQVLTTDRNTRADVINSIRSGI